MMITLEKARLALSSFAKRFNTAAAAVLPRLLWCLGALTPETSARLVAGIVVLLGGKTGAHGERVKQLSLVCPDLPTHEIKLLALGNLRNRGLMLGELTHLRKLQESPRHVRWLESWGLPAAVQSAERALYVGLPLANVWLGLCLSKPISSKLQLIYNSADPLCAAAPFRREFQGSRTSVLEIGAGQSALDVPLGDDISPLCRLRLNAGNGLSVPFGGSHISVDPLPAQLAWRLGCPIRIPVITRLAPACFALKSIVTLPTLPRTSVEQADWVLDTCARLAAFAGELIRKQPEEWFCEGKAIPTGSGSGQASSWSESVRV